jgi:response regulator RpfG family c-di-GMP phosphodiesterase
VDDEPHVLESLRDTLRRDFDVVTTANGFEALRILTERPCAVTLSDMRMPLLDGARFLTLARQHAPDTARVMLTGQATTDDAAAAINEGEIFRLLTKPCRKEDLIAALNAAVEHHDTLTRRREALADSERATAEALLKLASTVAPGAPARAKRVHQWASELATAAGEERPVELERACELMQIGAVALSRETLQQLAAGTRLGRDAAQELERLPELALPYVRGIPTLAATTHILERAARPFTAPRDTTGTPLAAALLRIALDYDLLERQEAPMETALRALTQRSGRYSPSLLETFIELVRYG